MRRPKEIRAAPKEWIEILQVTYPFLREEHSIGDLVLFGSQALSIYMKSPLRSKDLDLLSTQVSLRQIEELSSELSKLENVEFRSTTVQTRLFGVRRLTTHAIELRIAGKPFFIESFDGLLDGRPTSILTPYLELKKRWKLELWVPELEAILALRLAFRQPEGISRLNAMRLNSFVRENRKFIRYKHLNSILANWQIEKWVETNLIDLYKRNRVRIIDDNKIIPGIENRIKPEKIKQ